MSRVFETTVYFSPLSSGHAPSPKLFRTPRPPFICPNSRTLQISWTIPPSEARNSPLLKMVVYNLDAIEHYTCDEVEE